MLFFGAGIHRFLVRVANREDPYQTASGQTGLDVPFLSRPFSQTTSVQNFRTFTVVGHLS